MKLSYPSGTRETPPDRNPSTSHVIYEANTVAPHGFTLRSQLAVPAGRRFLLEHVELYLSRGLAAAPVGEAKGLCSINVGGTNYWILHNSHFNNTVNFAVIQTASPQMWLIQGDEIRLYTIDGSTGGNMNYQLAFFVLNYQA